MINHHSLSFIVAPNPTRRRIVLERVAAISAALGLPENVVGALPIVAAANLAIGASSPTRTRRFLRWSIASSVRSGWCSRPRQLRQRWKPRLCLRLRLRPAGGGRGGDNDSCTLGHDTGTRPASSRAASCSCEGMRDHSHREREGAHSTDTVQ